MKTPLIEKLNIPQLISTASHLALDGKLAISGNNLVYLDVDDAYINRLFPYSSRLLIMSSPTDFLFF